MDHFPSLLHLRKNTINRALRILLITNAMILIANYMVGPIYALFVKNIGGDLLDASFAAGVFAFTAGITTLLSGRFADRVKHPHLVVVLGYAAIGIGYLLYIFVDSLWFLLLCQIFIGLGEALYSPAFDAVYSQHLTHHNAGSQWGAWESVNYFCASLGAFIGGLIVSYFGFNILFIIMASLCFLSAVYIYTLPKKTL